MAASAAGARPGTPWQLGPSPSAWLSTLTLVLRSPRAVWRRVTPELSRSTSLLLVNTALSAGIGTAGVMYSGITHLAPRAAYAATFFIAGWTVMLAMSFIECTGVRFFGSRRGWRVDNWVAVAVVGHASFGWMALGLLVPAAWQLVNWLLNAGILRTYFRIAGAQLFAAIPFLAAAFVLGVIAFEILVYFGVRSMRFANASPRGAAGSIGATP